jgi:cytochrome b subunit of formate dehydrogenase
VNCAFPIGRRPHPAWLLTAACLTLCAAVVSKAADPENCLLCHQYRGLSRAETDGGRVHLFFVEAHGPAAEGPHARLACSDCHTREAFSKVPHDPAPRVDCTRTCHLQNPSGVAVRFSHQHAADLLAGSVHTQEALRRIQADHPQMLGADQSTCLFCHDEPVFRGFAAHSPLASLNDADVMNRCNTCHTAQLRTDVAFSLRHVGNRLQPARPPLEQAQICSVCHSNAEIRGSAGQHDAVASYLRSFHGKAALLDADETASCVDCHVARGGNAHAMLARDNPASATHPSNLANSCRSVQCHPGADPQFGGAAVHMDVLSMAGSLEYFVVVCFVLLTIATFGPSMAIVCLELLNLALRRHSPSDHRTESLAESLMRTDAGRRRLKRFTINQRVQHWTLAFLFVLLVLTGFPMKFADRDWAAWLVRAFGGLSVARLIHHWAGLALVAGMIAHLAYVFWTLVQNRRRERAAGRPTGWISSVMRLPMGLSPADLGKTFQLLAFLMFLRRERPNFGRFSVKDKFEYIGVFWGTALLGVTGIFLWGEQIFSHLIPGRLLNIALIAHTYEAFLALIHVGILHIVNVIFAPNVFPLSMATLTGDTPPAELAENHAEFVNEVAASLGGAGAATEGA